MDKANPAQERFSELIWRTLKLRVSLLIVAAVMLLVTWSGLTNGNVEARKIDVDFCRHRENELNETLKKLGWPNTDDRFDVCTAELARLSIESGRAIEVVLPFEGAAFSKRRVELAEYDQKRRAAYKLEIGLSSQGAESKVIVNALSVAEVVPFIVVLILSVVIVLGFQQHAYRIHLRSLLKDTKSAEELNQGIAGSQFLSGFDINNAANFGTWMVLSPEGTAIWVLSAAVWYLLVAVLAAFIVNLIHLTNSIFLNYLFALYALAFILAIALWRTLLKYQQQAEQKPKRAFRLFVLSTRWLNSKWCVGVLAAVAIFSVFLPWATTPLGPTHIYKGYSFILRQKPIFEHNGHMQYPVDPRTFSEIRFQLVPVALFLISCFFTSCVTGRRTMWARRLKTGNWFLALATVFLSLNYLLYMGTLQYGALTGTDLSSSLINLSLDRVKGFSMNWYDPAYGFLLFLFCCLLLAWVSLRANDNI